MFTTPNGSTDKKIEKKKYYYAAEYKSILQCAKRHNMQIYGCKLWLIKTRDNATESVDTQEQK